MDRHLAPVYDLASVMAGGVRRRAVEALAPEAGEVVLDVGCGTGLNFRPVLDGIGPEGRLVGVDRSAAMLAKARERVDRHGWANVTLVESAVDRLALDLTADALLLCLVHDVLRSRAGLRRVLACGRPGTRVVAAGAKWAPWWAAPLNLAVIALNQPYVESFEGFDQPWSVLADLVGPLAVEPLWEYGGGAYVAAGTLSG